ncbi:nitronate monooxygenase [Oceanobacillus piezotolerans]|uniref:Probable nitronate monooxygenase n=1 Tax=Oceanobacillus piezotolerans TaxID=2448030 RepID=A0A498D8W2_9BACI|nr:nitronate monooxygenase [Oceanobacillus piezotolerans]RLL46843.1 nitronate monooxygenase [Oceanobacillus piezotolerans]
MRKEAIERIKNSVELPVIVAPMFLINSPKMVINACASGVIGTFPVLNARTDEILEDWMIEITSELDRLEKENPDKKIAPWGVNFIVHRSNKRYVEDLELIRKYQPPVVITSLGDPGPVVEIVREYGGIVFSDVINIKFAKKAIEKGADGLVLVTTGAGGHAGTYNPISFVHEVREFFDGPIALSGGMSKGEDILISEILGADYAYIGTRFIPTEESMAQDEYKEMLIDSSIEDIIYTDAFSGINANYLIPSIKMQGLDPENLNKKDKIDFSELRDSEVKAWKHIWGAGHGIGPISQVQPIAEVIEELKQDYNDAIKEVSEKNLKTVQK